MDFMMIRTKYKQKNLKKQKQSKRKTKKNIRFFFGSS